MSEKSFSNSIYPQKILFTFGSCLVLFSPSVSADEINESDSVYLSRGSNSSLTYQSGNSSLSNAQYEQYLDLYDRLNQLGSLPYNWDGYGADPIPESLMAAARSFLEKVKGIGKYLSIFPTRRDSIQFEWELDGSYAEVEVFANHLELYAERLGEEIDEFSSSDEDIIGSRFVALFTGSRNT